MLKRTALSVLTLPTLWLFLSACGQTPTAGTPTAQVPRAITASTTSVRLHAQAVTDPTGQLVVWGQSVPTFYDNPTFTAVAMANYWGLALRSDGQITGVGNMNGSPVTAPALPTGVTYTGVAAGYGHALALRSDGQVVAWGSNDYGQLDVPALPTGMTYTRVAAGQNHSLALRSDGQIVAWGYDLGQIDTTPAPGGVTYTALTGGYAHTLALRSDGQIVGWGINTRGQLDVPALPTGMTYTAVAAGDLHTLALRSDGRVLAFGWNGNGQLNVPPLPAGMTYTAISARSQTSAALRSDGTIVVWGQAASASLPAPAAPGSRYTALAIGSLGGLAIRQTFDTPPTTPGVPTRTAGSTPNSTGAFTLSWTASTDSDGNALTYTLEGKPSASDATWTTVASGLTGRTYALSGVAEGTWTYRVRANDGIVDGANSTTSAAVTVDKTGPSAPTVQINGAAPTDGWYKDTASITVADSTDPVLVDGSAGTGVAGYQGAKTVTTSGTASYSGTATDAVGNVSTPTAGSVKVDATAPTVSFTSCPATVPMGSVQNLAWSAQDGESGLAGAASGSVTVPTGTTGPQTVTTTATDNVGHATTATCTTTVTFVYAFKGFQSPLNAAPALNVLSAGSAFPLKFSLGGYQGLGILAAGSPTIQPYPCAAGGPSGTAGRVALGTTTGLQYSASTDTYSYVGKAAKNMLGCYQVDVKLSDGTDHFVNVLFK